MIEPTVSERVREKSARLLVDGRVRIECGRRGIEARVVGDHDTYRVVREVDGRLRCTCPARVDTCSHRLAVERVTGGES